MYLTCGSVGASASFFTRPPEDLKRKEKCDRSPLHAVPREFIAKKDKTPADYTFPTLYRSCQVKASRYE